MLEIQVVAVVTNAQNVPASSLKIATCDHQETVRELVGMIRVNILRILKVPQGLQSRHVMRAFSSACHQKPGNKIDPSHPPIVT